jgi:hypothetical protein
MQRVADHLNCTWLIVAEKQNARCALLEALQIANLMKPVVAGKVAPTSIASHQTLRTANSQRITSACCTCPAACVTLLSSQYLKVFSNRSLPCAGALFPANNRWQVFVQFCPRTAGAYSLALPGTACAAVHHSACRAAAGGAAITTSTPITC